MRKRVKCQRVYPKNRIRNRSTSQNSLLSRSTISFVYSWQRGAIMYSFKKFKSNKLLWIYHFNPYSIPTAHTHMHIWLTGKQESVGWIRFNEWLTDWAELKLRTMAEVVLILLLFSKKLRIRMNSQGIWKELEAGEPRRRAQQCYYFIKFKLKT